MTAGPSRSAPATIGRFLGVGGANTVITGVIFYALSFPLPASVAYTIAFAIGIGIAIVVTPRFVFGTRPPARRLLAYAGWYVAVYALGLGMVYLLSDRMGLDRLLVVGITVVSTAAVSYLGARRLLASSGQA